MADILRFERLDSVALLTLDRPERLNAIGSDTHALLRSALDAIESDPALRAVVVTGSGSVFSAGADISEMRTLTDAESYEAFLLGFHDCYSRLSALATPTIAAVNGHALGGGFELALACDLRVVARTAKLGLPEIKLGMLPGAGGTQRLTRLVPMNIAKELILAGRTLDADRAYALGVVNLVADPPDLLPSALRLARDIAAGPPRAMAAGKRLLDEGIGLGLPAALELELDTGRALFGQPEATEGMSAFADKRPPRFPGPVADDAA
jgi:enoyl-CoA hydratase